MLRRSPFVAVAVLAALALPPVIVSAADADAPVVVHVRDDEQAEWSDVEAGSRRLPEIDIDLSIYPDANGVQFHINGQSDTRQPKARPDGFDVTGPLENSTYHIYPRIDLSTGDRLEARWVDRNGTAHVSMMKVQPFADLSVEPVLTSAPLTVWSDIEVGEGTPIITIDEVVYPNSAGVQFRIDGSIDDRLPRARPNGIDTSGPQESSKYHVYPRLLLKPGMEIEALWTDRAGLVRSSHYVVDVGQVTSPTSGDVPDSTAVTTQPTTLPSTSTSVASTTTPTTTAAPTTTTVAVAPTTTAGPPQPSTTAAPPTEAVANATWGDVAIGDDRLPTIVVNDDVYPNQQGVQFLLNGFVDERVSSARPNGFDATGPRDASTFHVYPKVSLQPGDTIEARWVDLGGTPRSNVHTVSDAVVDPANPPATNPPVTNPPVTNPPVTNPPVTNPPVTNPPVTNPPVTGAWPDGSTTGVRDASLLRASGSVTVSEDGAVVENLDIVGNITIDASDVTVRNVRVRGDGAKYLINIVTGRGNSGIVIEDVELDGRRIATQGIAHGGYTARRVNIHSVEDGIRAGGNTALEDSWIHDLGHDGAWTSDPHSDAIQSIGGTNITIRNNRLEGPWRAQTSAIILASHYGGPLRNVLIEGNLLSGGTATLYLLSRNEGAPGTPLHPVLGSEVVVRGNTWVRDSAKFVPVSTERADGVAWGVNYWDDGTIFQR